jgi:hypothetical protein
MIGSYATLGTRWTTRDVIPRRVVVARIVTPTLVLVRDERDGTEWLEQVATIERDWTRRASFARAGASL